MPAPTLQRLEVWSDYQCASGTRLAFLPVDHCTAVETVERVTRDDEGTLVVPKDVNAYEVLAPGVVIRFLLTDGTFSEWRVHTLEDTSRQSRLVTLGLRSPIMELQTSGVLSLTTSGAVTVDLDWKALTPSDIVTKILVAAPSYFTAGTITPTIPVDLTPSGWTPLRALRELVAAIRAQGVSAELNYRRNGTTGYYVDVVTAIGSSAATLDVRRAKNLLTLTRTKDRTKYGTEAMPIGTGSPRATMARAWFELTAKSGATLTLQQPVTGGAVVAFDDQLNTSRYLIDDTGARQQITDCTASTQQVVVASGTNFTVGRWYRVAANSGGDELASLRVAAGTAGPVQVVESSVLGATTNLAGNPGMRIWTGGASDAPDGWTKGGFGTYTRTTTDDLWYYGGKSCRVQQGGGITVQLESSRVALYVPTWATSIVYSMWIKLTTVGASTLEWRRDGANVSTTSLSGYATGVWHRVDYTASLSGLTGAVHDFSVRYYDTVSACDVYVDSVQITFAATAAAFVEGSDPARLWSLANRYLSTYGTVPTVYEVAFANLGQWSPADFPFDAVEIGQTARVREETLDVSTSGRILELRRDWKNPLASNVTIASRPEDLVSYLTNFLEAA